MRYGYLYEDYWKYGITLPLEAPLAYKCSNILVSGKSGSGKSLSCLWYIHNMLATNESYVYIADYKGGEEYAYFEGSVSYASGNKAIDLIESFYELFSSVRENKIQLENHYTLFIEEWSGLLNFAETKSKKLRVDLMNHVGEMLAVARGLNLGIMLAMQRCDSSNFSSGARDQFQVMINFGRCSTEQFKMLGFSNELDENPTFNFKSGQALALIDNQLGIQKIIVPLIKNTKQMTEYIRIMLDRQSSLVTLIHQIAESNLDG